MRIGVVAPVTPQWPKMDWVEQALRADGHGVTRVVDWSGLAQADAENDLLLFMQKSPIRWPNMRAVHAAHKALWCQWWFDLIATEPTKLLAEQDIFRSHREVMQAMDLVFVKERGLLDHYRAEGVNAYWLDQGCPEDMPVATVQEHPAWDVLLWGQIDGYRQRYRDVEALIEAGFSVAWASHQGNVPKGCERLPWTEPMQLHRLASQARCVLCVDRRSDLDGYWSDRLWMAAGMGCCILWRGEPEIGWPLWAYRDAKALEMSAFSLCRSADRAQIGKNVRAWAMENTYRHRCRDLLAAVRYATASVT